MEDQEHEEHGPVASKHGNRRSLLNPGRMALGRTTGRQRHGVEKGGGTGTGRGTDTGDRGDGERKRNGDGQGGQVGRRKKEHRRERGKRRPLVGSAHAH